MYSDIRTIWVPAGLLDETRRYLQQPGAAGHEGFVLWTGTKNAPGEISLRRAIFPVQKPTRTRFGLKVEVQGAELDRINRECYRLKELLFAQIHTHPGAAYHSDLDDAKPLVTSEGCLSIVIPNFAKEPLGDLTHTAVYKLTRGTWVQLSPVEVSKLIRRAL